MDQKAHQMCSRQGRATIHMHPIAFGQGAKRPRTKSIELESPANMKKLLQDMEELRAKEEAKQNAQPPRASSNFKAVTREEREFAERNRTNSPHACRYKPNYDYVKSRMDRAMNLGYEQTSPRKAKILLSRCLNDDLSCSFPSKKRGKAKKQEVPDRLIDADEYQDRVETKNAVISPVPDMPAKHLKSAIPFTSQLKRPAFVTEKDPPNQHRFSFAGCSSTQYSKNRRTNSLPFKYHLERKELYSTEANPKFYEYDKCKEKVLPRLTHSLIPFEKIPGRRSLAIDSMLKTPVTWHIDAYNKSLRHTKPNSKHIPSIDSYSPRDDRMYRTVEAYNMNVPEKLLASESPRYLAETQLSLNKSLKERFNQTYTKMSIS